MRFHRKRQGYGTIALRENPELIEQVIAAKAVQRFREEQERRREL